MPDLGKYALVVGLSYGVTLALLAGMVVVTLWQGRRAKDDLARTEARLEGDRRDE